MSEPERRKLFGHAQQVVRWSARIRQGAGYLMFVVALVFMASVAWWAAHSLDEPPSVASSEMVPVALATLALHAATVLALAWLGYQLLKISERLTLPFWAVRDPRVLLGIEAPQDRALSVAKKEVLDIVRAAAGALGGDGKKGE